jgi:hypothetical protein
LPAKTIVMIIITSTTNGSNPTGVCADFLLLFLLESRFYILFFRTYISSKKRETRNSSNKSS